MRSKILYIFYFLIWTIFLVLIYAYQTDKYYELTQIIAPLVGLFTIALTGIVVIVLILLLIFKADKRRKYKKAIIICLSPLLMLTPLIYSYFHLNDLDDKTQTIELSYIDWACDCADWATPEQLNKLADNVNDTLGKVAVYIEPIDKSKELPDSIYWTGTTVKFHGQFYKHKKFPKNYFSVELPGRAKVFRYDNYEIIKVAKHTEITSD
jgi:hypothetical protein